MTAERQPPALSRDNAYPLVGEIKMAEQEQPTQDSYTTDEAADNFADILDPEGSREYPDDDSANAADDDHEDDDGELETPEGDSLDDDDQDLVDEDDDDLEEQEELEEADEAQAYQMDDADTLEINGEQVTFKELKDGQLRQADYTRKTQELAHHRQQFDAYAQQQQQAFGEQSQRLDASIQMLEQMTIADQSIDWDTLAQQDPSAFVQMKEQVNNRQQILNQNMQEQQQRVQQQQQAQMQQQAGYVQQQRQALLKEWPHWSDPAVATQEKQVLNTYLAGQGFSEQEILGLADFNALKVINKARKFDELQAKNPRTRKRIKKAPKTLKPQGRTTKGEQRLQTAKAKTKRLRQTGSLEDAASALMDRM